jgi:hypothetical protein
MTAPIDTSPEAVARMLEGVTPGPWRLGPDEEGDPAQCITADGFDIATAWGGYNAADADAHFIAYAREAVPALAARVAELEAEREPDCTDCEGSGITHQTERYCACHSGRELAVYARAEAAETKVVKLTEALGLAIYGMSWAAAVFREKDPHLDDPCPPVTRGKNAARAALEETKE